VARSEIVNFPWAIRLAREDAASLAEMRPVAGLEVAAAGTEIWLRGPANESLQAKLFRLPACARYELIPPNQLRPIDQRIPSNQLPELPWQPLNAWLQVESPVAAFPAQEPRAVSLRLVRSTVELEPELLLTSMEEFQRFAARAAQVRLDRLQFAANPAGSVLIRGTPLPPLPGQRFVLHGGVAVPAGFTWQPAVSDEVLARRFAVASEALVLWNEDGTLTRLHGEQFVAATRGAVRATAQALAEPK